MKNNKKQSNTVLAIVAIIAFTVIMIFAILKYGGDNMNSEMMSGSSNLTTSVQPDTKSTDYKQYAALSGEDYDRLFLSNMIAHHEGAVEMANMALKNAKHQEVKDLAKTIISTQTSEITNMTSWQATWGYPASSGAAMMDHSAMGMMDSNVGMMRALGSQTGEVFDKAFLEQMIMHHQSAINMAATGRTNASHQEVKDLTAAIVTAQTKEIKQMRKWQKDWKYTN